MQCDCLTQVTESVLERVKGPDHAGPTANVECGAVAITFGGKELAQRLYIPFNVTADKTGYRSKKGKELPVFCTYCPFCGKLATKPEENTDAPT